MNIRISHPLNGRNLGKNDKHIYREVECPNCKEKRYVQRRDKRVTGLCRKCWHSTGGNHKGDASYLWNGGVVWQGGYKCVIVPKDSPFSSMRTLASYVREHRLVMAKHIGRPLESWEVVHHINGIKTDNHIENLELLTSQKEHLYDLRLKARLKQLEYRVTLLEAENTLLKTQLSEVI